MYLYFVPPGYVTVAVIYVVNVNIGAGHQWTQYKGTKEYLDVN